MSCARPAPLCPWPGDLTGLLPSPCQGRADGAGSLLLSRPVRLAPQGHPPSGSSRRGPPSPWPHTPGGLLQWGLSRPGKQQRLRNLPISACSAWLSHSLRHARNWDEVAGAATVRSLGPRLAGVGAAEPREAVQSPELVGGGTGAPQSGRMEFKFKCSHLGVGRGPGPAICLLSAPRLDAGLVGVRRSVLQGTRTGQLLGERWWGQWEDPPCDHGTASASRAAAPVA